MGLISGCVWILPAVTVAGWALSWWGPRWIRWGVPAAAALVSVLCCVVGAASKGPPVSPQSVGCSPAFACMDWDPIYWLEAGLIGFGCCVVLLVATVVVEAIGWIGRRVGASS